MAGLGVVELRVGVLGASSMVGECLLPILSQAERQVVAFSRRPEASTSRVDWLHLPVTAYVTEIPYWI